MLLFLIVLIPFAAAASEPAGGTASYDLDQCIAVALDKHPSLKASAGDIRARESRVGQARSKYYPWLDVSAGYQKIGPTTPPGDSIDSYDQYSTGFNLGVTLFDFGKTSANVAIQDLNVNASRADYDDVKAQIILNVKKLITRFCRTSAIGMWPSIRCSSSSSIWIRQTLFSALAPNRNSM